MTKIFVLILFSVVLYRCGEVNIPLYEDLALSQFEQIGKGIRFGIKTESINEEVFFDITEDFSVEISWEDKFSVGLKFDPMWNQVTTTIRETPTKTKENFEYKVVRTHEIQQTRGVFNNEVKTTTTDKLHTTQKGSNQVHERLVKKTENVKEQPTTTSYQLVRKAVTAGVHYGRCRGPISFYLWQHGLPSVLMVGTSICSVKIPFCGLIVSVVAFSATTNFSKGPVEIAKELFPVILEESVVSFSALTFSNFILPIYVTAGVFDGFKAECPPFYEFDTSVFAGLIQDELIRTKVKHVDVSPIFLAQVLTEILRRTIPVGMKGILK